MRPVSFFSSLQDRRREKRGTQEKKRKEVTIPGERLRSAERKKNGKGRRRLHRRGERERKRKRINTCTPLSQQFPLEENRERRGEFAKGKRKSRDYANSKSCSPFSNRLAWREKHPGGEKKRRSHDSFPIFSIGFAEKREGGKKGAKEEESIDRKVRIILFIRERKRGGKGLEKKGGEEGLPLLLPLSRVPRAGKRKGGERGNQEKRRKRERESRQQRTLHPPLSSKCRSRKKKRRESKKEACVFLVRSFCEVMKTGGEGGKGRKKLSRLAELIPSTTARKKGEERIGRGKRPTLHSFPR